MMDMEIHSEEGYSWRCGIYEDTPGQGGIIYTGVVQLVDNLQMNDIMPSFERDVKLSIKAVCVAI